ncbi:MAG: XrtA/PEP-CTERM system histidine kinase PrsK [Thiohalorhabdus sp.]|uniref:XrtA/PEP-CTERM system histidine kinase PrsK n=1 Tax=Thiohalorhabdus sp. TaxID=3094134 RepID=UPI003980EE73
MPSIAALSYAGGMAAFLALTLVLAIGWRGRSAGTLLLLAASGSTLWAAFLAWQAWSGQGGTVAVALADGLRYGLWFAFLAGLLRGLAEPRLFRGIAGIAAGLPVLHFLGAAWGDWAGSESVGAVLGGSSMLTGILLAVFGLLLVEQTLRSTEEDGRWAIKYLSLGLGAIFAYDFFLFADGLLVQRTDLDLWAARGAVNALVVPLIAVSAARNPSWSLDVYVSRSMVLHTATLVGAGLYMLVMAGVGYSIRAYGGMWSGTVQAVFLFGAGVLLAVLLFSGQLRAQARVFLSKHFFNYKYDYREEWLRFAATLADEEGGPLKERVIRALGRIVESRGGVLWKRDDNGDFRSTAAWNMRRTEADPLPREDPLARFLEESGWVLEAGEWRERPYRYRGIAVPEWFSAQPEAWLVVPLIYRESLIGFVVLGEPRAGTRTLDWEDYDLIKTAGRQAASYIAQEEAAEALGEAQQFETYHRLSAFVLHDLKNVMGQLSLLAQNASRHKHNPEFVDDAVLTIEHSVERMQRLMEQLRGGRNLSQPVALDLAECAREAVAAHGDRLPVPGIEESGPVGRVVADRGRLVAVLGHIIQNAQDATGDGGSVGVRVRRDGDDALIEIEDDGSGMEADFIRNRLFKPFDTSKGSTGMGIGAYEAREYVRELGGDVEVSSAPGSGTRFRIRFPEEALVEEPMELAREVGQ